MYSFEGDYRRRPRQDLSGASKKVHREDLLKQSALRRQNREDYRRQEQAALKLQAFIRSFISKKKQAENQRYMFDQHLRQYEMSKDSTFLGQLLKRLIFFYDVKLDDQRLMVISQLFLTNSEEIIKATESDYSVWLYRLKHLLHFNLHRLSHQLTDVPVAIPLRLLEVYTTTGNYHHKDSEKVKIFLRHLWLFLIMSGYFIHLKTLLERRIPDLDEVSSKPPTPLAEALLTLILKPFDAVQSFEYKVDITRALLRGLFSSTPKSQILNFILPSLIERTSVFPPEMVLRAIMGQPPLQPSVWLLHATVSLVAPHTESLTCQAISLYLKTLRHLVVSIQPPVDVKLFDDGDDEEDEKMEVSTEDDQLHSTIENIISTLNSPESVSALVLGVEKLQGKEQSLTSLCIVCHTLLGRNRLAMHKYRFLYTLAFRSGFLRMLWNSILLTTTSSVFRQTTTLLQMITSGLPLSKLEVQEFLPQLILFCNLFGQLIPTLHEEEFYGSSSETSAMPFSLSELITMTRLLRDLCLGLIELAFPDTRPSISECIGSKNLHHATEIPQVHIWIQLFQSSVSLLRQLYGRDSRRQFCPENHWIAKQAHILPDRVADWNLKISYLRSQPFSGVRQLTREQFEEEGPPMSTSELRHTTILQELPFVVPFHIRVKIFQNFISKDRMGHSRELSNFNMGPQIHLMIRRNYIYEDAFDKLSPENEPNLRYLMRVQLVNAVGLDEAGIDGGGIFREFLSELLKTAFDPNRGFFKTTHDRLLYPNPAVHLLVPDFPRHYYFIGRMLGKAIYENMLVELPFADFFLDKLLARQSVDLDIHHLASLDPVMYKNLVYLKTYEGDVSELGLDFTVLNSELGENQVEELKPNGGSIAVTALNRIEYIHLMADYRLNKQIRAQCNAFKQGLADVVQLEWIHMFDSKELQVLISGAHTPVDLDDLKYHTNYAGGYTSSHPVIQTFWKVVQRFDEKQRHLLLKFVTSCSRPPLLGFKELSPPFCIQSAGPEPDRLPTASTCMNLLKLPEITDEKVMQEKLSYAIESGAGFELS